MRELTKEHYEKADSLLELIRDTNGPLSSDYANFLFDSSKEAIFVCSVLEKLGLINVISATENDPFYLFESTLTTNDFIKKGGFSTDYDMIDSTDNTYLGKDTLLVLKNFADGESYTITKDRPEEIRELMPKLVNLDIIRKTDRFKYGATSSGRRQLKKLIELKSWEKFLNWINLNDPSLQSTSQSPETSVKFETDKTMIDIFISHYNGDEEKADILIRILRAALGLKKTQIRCTSVAGYKLPGGASTDETLRQEIVASKVFIALLTEKSVKRTYVLFELGARWGTDKSMKVLVCEPSMSKVVQGPLVNLHCFNGSKTTDIIQLVGECAKILKLNADTPDVYLADINKLSALSKIKDTSDTSENEKAEDEPTDKIPDPNIDISEVRKAILNRLKVEHPNDYSTQEYLLNEQMDALRKLQEPSKEWQSLPEYKNIYSEIAKNHPEDYSTQLYLLEEQIKALLRLSK